MCRWWWQHNNDAKADNAGRNCVATQQKWQHAAQTLCITDSCHLSANNVHDWNFNVAEIVFSQFSWWIPWSIFLILFDCCSHFIVPFVSHVLLEAQEACCKCQHFDNVLLVWTTKQWTWKWTVEICRFGFVVNWHWSEKKPNFHCGCTPQWTNQWQQLCLMMTLNFEKWISQMMTSFAQECTTAMIQGTGSRSRKKQHSRRDSNNCDSDDVCDVMTTATKAVATTNWHKKIPRMHHFWHAAMTTKQQCGNLSQHWSIAADGWQQEWHDEQCQNHRNAQDWHDKCHVILFERGHPFLPTCHPLFMFTMHWWLKWQWLFALLTGMMQDSEEMNAENCWERKKEKVMKEGTVNKVIQQTAHGTEQHHCSSFHWFCQSQMITPVDTLSLMRQWSWRCVILFCSKQPKRVNRARKANAWKESETHVQPLLFGAQSAIGCMSFCFISNEKLVCTRALLQIFACSGTKVNMKQSVIACDTAIWWKCDGLQGTGADTNGNDSSCDGAMKASDGLLEIQQAVLFDGTRMWLQFDEIMSNVSFPTHTLFAPLLLPLSFFLSFCLLLSPCVFVCILTHANSVLGFLFHIKKSKLSSSLEQLSPLWQSQWQFTVQRACLFCCKILSESQFVKHSCCVEPSALCGAHRDTQHQCTTTAPWHWQLHTEQCCAPGVAAGHASNNDVCESITAQLVKHSGSVVLQVCLHVVQMFCALGMCTLFDTMCCAQTTHVPFCLMLVHRVHRCTDCEFTKTAHIIAMIDTFFALSLCILTCVLPLRHCCQKDIALACFFWPPFLSSFSVNVTIDGHNWTTCCSSNTACIVSLCFLMKMEPFALSTLLLDFMTKWLNGHNLWVAAIWAHNSVHNADAKWSFSLIVELHESEHQSPVFLHTICTHPKHPNHLQHQWLFAQFICAVFQNGQQCLSVMKKQKPLFLWHTSVEHHHFTSWSKLLHWMWFHLTVQSAQSFSDIFSLFGHWSALCPFSLWQWHVTSVCANCTSGLFISCFFSSMQQFKQVTTGSQVSLIWLINASSAVALTCSIQKHTCWKLIEAFICHPVLLFWCHKVCTILSHLCGTQLAPLTPNNIHWTLCAFTTACQRLIVSLPDIDNSTCSSGHHPAVVSHFCSQVQQLLNQHQQSCDIVNLCQGVVLFHQFCFVLQTQIALSLNHHRNLGFVLVVLVHLVVTMIQFLFTFCNLALHSIVFWLLGLGELGSMLCTTILHVSWSQLHPTHSARTSRENWIGSLHCGNVHSRPTPQLHLLLLLHHHCIICCCHCLLSCCLLHLHQSDWNWNSSSKCCFCQCLPFVTSAICIVFLFTVWWAQHCVTFSLPDRHSVVFFCCNCNCLTSTEGFLWRSHWTSQWIDPIIAIWTWWSVICDLNSQFSEQCRCWLFLTKCWTLQAKWCWPALSLTICTSPKHLNHFQNWWPLPQFVCTMFRPEQWATLQSQRNRNHCFSNSDSSQPMTSLTSLSSATEPKKRSCQALALELNMLTPAPHLTHWKSLQFASLQCPHSMMFQCSGVPLDCAPAMEQCPLPNGIVGLNRIQWSMLTARLAMGTHKSCHPRKLEPATKLTVGIARTCNCPQAGIWHCSTGHQNRRNLGSWEPTKQCCSHLEKCIVKWHGRHRPRKTWLKWEWTNNSRATIRSNNVEVDSEGCVNVATDFTFAKNGTAVPSWFSCWPECLQWHFTVPQKIFLNDCIGNSHNMEHLPDVVSLEIQIQFQNHHQCCSYWNNQCSYGIGTSQDPLFISAYLKLGTSGWYQVLLLQLRPNIMMYSVTLFKSSTGSYSRILAFTTFIFDYCISNLCLIFLLR